MQVSCPSCATNFSVPDRALMPNGRTLKCARCGHKWFQTLAQPELEPDPLDDFGLDEDSFPPPPSASPGYAEADYAPAPRYDEDVGIPEPPLPDFARPDTHSDLRAQELDLSDDPAPIPAIFSSEEKKERSALGLWLLCIILFLGAAFGGIYYFQDRVVPLVPGLHEAMTSVGLRKEYPGAGLELRHAGTPERFVQNDTEVLVVRGIIANISDRDRPVPPMKLVLLDAGKAVVQEKAAQPPVANLAPGGTAGFRIILERPNPTATEVNVLFVDVNEQK